MDYIEKDVPKLYELMIKAANTEDQNIIVNLKELLLIREQIGEMLDEV
jgi:hypothetical protein